MHFCHYDLYHLMSLLSSYTTLYHSTQSKAEMGSSNLLDSNKCIIPFTTTMKQKAIEQGSHAVIIAPDVTVKLH